jgi:cell division septation protein DedD
MKKPSLPKKPSFPKMKVGLPKLRGPKLPSIKAPKLSAPRLGGPQLHLPPFLNNLFRDMRDRRLLLPALALVVALIAVPVLLKSSSSSTPPPPPPSSSADTADSAAQPAVVAQQIGITDYKKRLDRFKTKNPFRQHFTSLPGSAKLNTTSTGSAPSTTSTSTSSSTTSTGGSSSVTPLPTSTGPATTTTTSSPPSPSPSPSPAPNPKPAEPRFFVFHASLAIGPSGDLVKRKAVKEFTFLPTYSRPLVAFLGIHGDLNHAIFLVSDDVSSVSGDGQCLPRRNKCTFLVMKPGDTAKLKYAPEGDRTYKLRLTGIKLSRVNAPQKTSGKLKGGQPEASQIVAGAP